MPYGGQRHFSSLESVACPLRATRQPSTRRLDRLTMLSSTDTTGADSQPPMVSIVSKAFGRHHVPRHCIHGMTSSRIVQRMAELCGSVASVACHGRVLHLDPQLDDALDSLECGARLRADMPVLYQCQLASFIVKCWTYLVWLDAVHNDRADGGVAGQQRDQIVWWMMRPYESSFTTAPDINDLRNSHAKHKIKNGLILTALLLRTPTKLALIGRLGHVSADALVSLSQRELNHNTLEVLTEQAARTSVNITKHNIRGFLQRPSAADNSAMTDGPPSPSSPAPSTARSSSSERVRFRLSPSLSALFSTPPSTPPSSPSPTPATAAVSHLAEPDVTEEEAAGASMEVDEARDDVLQEADDEVETEAVGNESGEEQHEQANEKQSEGEVADEGGDQDEGAVQDDPMDATEADAFGLPALSVEGTAPLHSGRTCVRAVKQQRQKQWHKRTQRPYNLHSATPSKRVSRVVVKAARPQMHQPSAAPQPSATSEQPARLETPPRRAVDRLRTVQFRAPDDVRGCVDDDEWHDLFCCHHRAWRQQALTELGKLSTDQLEAIRHQSSPSSAGAAAASISRWYLELAHQWGQRIQFVAPVQLSGDVSMDEALRHVSLEPHAHDSGWLFHSHSGLEQVLCQRAVAKPAAAVEDFRDSTQALCSADPRKYWVFASDHARDDEAGGNSAHMLAVYRLFTGNDRASFDADSGVCEQLPLGLFLQLGCMLVVVVQREGCCVYVPSASANESAHLVTTVSDRAAVSVAGNVLNPRHIARLVRQHEEDGPSEVTRIEWARDFVDREATTEADTELYTIEGTGTTLQVPTAATIADIHAFLCGVVEGDARYQPEYFRLSWTADLFSTSQACRILGEALDSQSLPASLVVEQLLDVGRLGAADVHSALSALLLKASSSSAAAGSNGSMSAWHQCHSRFSCPSLISTEQLSEGALLRRVHSIQRPPLLLQTTGVDATQLQLALARHVHQAITREIITCNSLVPTEQSSSPPATSRSTKQRQQPQQSRDDRGGYEFQKWGNTSPGSGGKDKMTVGWIQDKLRERGAVYLCDVSADVSRAKLPAALWDEQTTLLVHQLIGEQTANGFLLRHCAHKGVGVHTPSFFALFAGRGSSMAASSHHSESHRCAAWHLLLHHPKPACGSVLAHTDRAALTTLPWSLSSSSSACLPSSSSVSPSREQTAATRTIAAAALSLIHRAMASKTRAIAGSDHYLDAIDPADRARVPTSAAALYANSASLSFGQLTEDTSQRVLRELAMTSSSRLLDVGSAFGRFCVYAALAAPPGACVTGIEVGIKRAQLAAHFVDELTAEHSAIMQPVRANIKLVQGDILDHMQELLVHSHVFMFDARFMESTWRILAHLLSYMAGVTDQVVVSCQSLHTHNRDLLCQQRVQLSTGENKFTAHVFRVDRRKKSWHAVEVYRSAVHGLGVRAVRTLRVGQTIMQVVGESIDSSTFNQLRDASKRRMYPYLTRIPSANANKRVFLHALDVSRYINSRVGTAHSQNVAYKYEGGELLVVAVREIKRGEELLSDYDNWTSDEGQRPWLTDRDMSG